MLKFNRLCEMHDPKCNTNVLVYPFSKIRQSYVGKDNSHHLSGTALRTHHHPSYYKSAQEYHSAPSDLTSLAETFLLTGADVGLSCFFGVGKSFLSSSRTYS